MALRRLVPLTLALSLLVASLIAAAVLLPSPQADALPPAGEDVFSVSGLVNASSRLGQEVISVVGTVGINRSPSVIEGGVEVQDVVITSLDLEGQSLTGAIFISHNKGRPSVGEVRSVSPSSEFPATMFLDVFAEVRVPASPSQTNPLTLRNDTPFRITPASGGTIGQWPPLGVTFQSFTDPCTPLFPTLPAEVCVHSLEVTLLAGAPQNPTFSVAPGGPSDIHPADLVGLVTPPPPTSVPTNTPSGPLPTPTNTPIPQPAAENDNFANAFEITQLPFAGTQNTVGATDEPGEQLTIPSCVLVSPYLKGATVWFRFTAPQTGTATADTQGSVFDTVLAAYSGTTLPSLILLNCNDDTFGLQSQIMFPVSQGTTYYLQAGGFGGDTGDLRLNLSVGGGGASGMPILRITCQALGLTDDGCDDGSDGDQDDIDALSFGADYGEAVSDMMAFSVAPGSLGLPGSAVAAQAACSPPQPQADEFSSILSGTNLLVFDGDGLGGACPPGPTLRLTESPQSDDLDALTGQSASYVDPNADGVPEELVFFSLAPGSPSLAMIGASPADVLAVVNGVTPGIYASAAALGLQAGDDLDALCIDEDGIGTIFAPGFDRISFSLAAGSPTLAAIGASPADVLGPGPTVLVQAAELGLQDGDDLDALKCFEGGGSITPTPTPSPANGDVNKDGRTTSVDATILLQHVAGLVANINPRGDVNEDGRITSVDATIILQFVAGLIDSLPV